MIIIIMIIIIIIIIIIMIILIEIITKIRIVAVQYCELYVDKDELLYD